jgi:hypothetical protein
MPNPVPYTPRPFVGEPYEPRDNPAAYIRQRGREDAEQMRRSGANSAALWSGIGSAISGTLRDIAAYPEQQRAKALLEQKRQREEQAYQEEQRQQQQAAQIDRAVSQLQQQYRGQRIPTDVLLQHFPMPIVSKVNSYQDSIFGSQADAEKRGRDIVTDMGGYGPLGESSVDDVMQSPAAGRVRYGFGPGMANGPEVMPNAVQQAKIAKDQVDAQERAAFRKWMETQGGTMTPGGGAAYPPKPSDPPRPVSVAPGNRLVNPATGRVVFTAPPAEKTPSDDVTELTPEGLDAAALNYAKTGMLPPLGMGDKTTRKQIINRAAAMMPGLDIASAKADYGANQSSLTALQKQRDALGAFEETAIKNLDVFLAAAKNIPDMGSPLLNRPLRALNERVLGGVELSAYNTARRTVIPEFAKILANPGLSGQLSDSARHEIEDVISGNATLAQTIAAASVLKQDTENRRRSYDDQIAGIRARLAKGSQGQTPPPPTSPGVNPFRKKP